ncbi:MAG: hypothetical protein ACXW11_06140 [Methylotenera sp.]
MKKIYKAAANKYQDLLTQQEKLIAAKDVYKNAKVSAEQKVKTANTDLQNKMALQLRGVVGDLEIEKARYEVAEADKSLAEVSLNIEALSIAFENLSRETLFARAEKNAALAALNEDQILAVSKILNRDKSLRKNLMLAFAAECLNFPYEIEIDLPSNHLVWPMFLIKLFDRPSQTELSEAVKGFKSANSIND